MIYKVLFIFLLVFPVFSYGEVSLPQIIETLSTTEIRPEVRRELLQKVALYPSSEAILFLKEIIYVDPEAEVQQTAREVLRHFQKMDDYPILIFKVNQEEVTLKNIEFEEGVSAFGGSVKTFLGGYFWKIFLESEMSPQMKKIIEDKINRWSPSPSELTREKAKEVLALSDMIMDYYGERKVLNYLAVREFEQQKKEKREELYGPERDSVFRSLVNKRLGLSAKSPSDFGPGRLREVNKMIKQIIQDHPPDSWTPTWLDSFLKDYPYVPTFLETRRAQVEGVWFVIPGLEKYRELDPNPKHCERAADTILGFHEKALSEEMLQWCSKEVRSILEMSPPKEEVDRLKPAKTYAERLDQELQNEKNYIATVIPQLYESGILADFSEKVQGALQVVFTKLRENIKNKKWESYWPSEAFRYALEETLGQFFEGLTGEEKEQMLIKILLRFTTRRLDRKFRDVMFQYLEEKRFQVGETYRRTMASGIFPQEKHAEVFRQIIEEMRVDLPAEVTEIQPDWFEQGGEGLSPQARYVERSSFYGEQRKYPGELGVYYLFDESEPSIQLFHWLDFKEIHFFELDEYREERQVAALLRDRLVAEATKQFIPEVKAELFKKYGQHVQIFGSPEFTDLVLKILSLQE